MATKIVTKNSSTAGAAPTATDLVQGELAVNVADKRLYTEDNAGAIVELGTNPTTLNVNGTATMDGLSVNGAASISGIANANLQLASTGGNTYQLRTDVDSVYIYQANRAAPIAQFGYDGDISFYDDSGNAKLFWDASAERLGLGTASPDHKLHIETTNDSAFRLTRTGIRSFRQYINSTGTFVIRDLSGTPADRFAIDSSGNVGIGTSSPVVKLAVKSSQEQLTLSEGDSRGATFDYRSSTGNLNIATNGINARTNPQFTLDLNGNVGIGTSSPAAKLDVSGVFQFFDDTTPELKIVDSDDNNYALIGYTDGTMSLSSNHGNEAGGADVMQFLTGGSERMRACSKY